MALYKIPTSAAGAPPAAASPSPVPASPPNPMEVGSITETEPWLVQHSPDIGQVVGSLLGGGTGAIGGGTVGAGAGAVAGGGLGAVPGGVAGTIAGLQLGREVGAAGGRASGQAVRDLYHLIRGDSQAPQSFGQGLGRVGMAGGEGALSEAVGGRLVPWGAFKVGQGGLVLSGLSPQAAKTALEEGIIVAKGKASRMLQGAAGKLAAGAGGAKAAVQRLASAVRGVAPDIAEQQASRDISYGYEKLIGKQADASKFVSGVLGQMDSTPGPTSNINLQEVLNDAMARTISRGPKGTPKAEQDALVKIATDYIQHDAQEWAGSVPDTRAHEIFQDQNQLARQVFNADNPRYSAVATRFHNALREVLRDKLTANAGPLASVLDRAMQRQSRLIMLARELSGGEIEAGVERKFVRPAANQTARTAAQLATLATVGGGAAMHNPLASTAGLVGGTVMSHPAMLSQSAMIMNPTLWELAGRFGLAPAMAGDVYKKEQER